jgi:glycerol-3-phosphate acyltransferase PlsX
MDESPTEAVRRKRDSSISVSARLLKSGDAEAMVSAGNTAAALACTRSVLGKLKGVDRPAIATIFPNMQDFTILLDVGANAGGCKPEHYLQFAIMGEIYAREVMHKEKPRIGLLSVGEEKSKGNAITLEAFPILEQSGINFVGNVEGNDIVNGTTDVVVCDGFVGNVILKLTEGIGDMIFELIKYELAQSKMAKLGMIFALPALKRFKERVNYEEYGGAPLLGINGTCIIGHGKSNANAIKNAVRVASEFIYHKVNNHIEKNLQMMKNRVVK